jgi:hypothetical protein
MNELYHQRMESKCDLGDKLIRIVVMAIAVGGLVFAVPDLTNPWVGFVVSIMALVAAAILNIVPAGDWAKHHGEMFRLWCDLRGDAEREHLKTCEVSDDDKVKEAGAERLVDLWGKVAPLNAAQQAPDDKLLKECHEKACRQLGLDPCPPATNPSPCPSAARG